MYVNPMLVVMWILSIMMQPRLRVAVLVFRIVYRRAFAVVMFNALPKLYRRELA
jgi:hypothetical protein